MSTAVTANESTHLDKASGGRKAKDQLARIIMWLAFLVALAPLAWILYEVLSNGLDNLLTSTWWTNSQRGISVRREGGGAYHAIMGTLLQGLVTAAISVPIAETHPLQGQSPYSASKIGAARVLMPSIASLGAGTRQPNIRSTSVAYDGDRVRRRRGPRVRPRPRGDRARR